ncbi:MAG: Ku-like_protein [uncultured Solirubrobacterales bacterium]|uniref:Non-homologous end joining protein Ku n=1 Tax=uncultured Solirubrobacterales bacterium TaxID=768556 RepID=A0A6J4SAW7_9ACTN|nr:MAG: Ku-like_protein [uncultured Solirubrobacterales bacterium]
MRSIWKGTISFGLVNIPVAVGIATQRSDPKFRTLDRETLQPIKQQLFSPARGEVVQREETVKGYEVSKDRYLPMSDEELEAVAVERRRTIDLVAFVDLGEIDPVFYDRTYYLEPGESAQKPYALLVEAMKRTGKAALGKIVMSSREHVVLLRPAGDTLVAELLFYPEDVRSKAEIDERVGEIDVTDQEVAMATQLVESLARPFEPKEFENEHKRELLALIERKLSGEEVPVAAEPAPAEPVPDLMAALKASIDQARQPAPAEGAPSGGGGSKPKAKPKAKTAKANGKATTKGRAKAGTGAKGSNGSEG